MFQTQTLLPHQTILCSTSSSPGQCTEYWSRILLYFATGHTSIHRHILLPQHMHRGCCFRASRILYSHLTHCLKPCFQMCLRTSSKRSVYGQQCLKDYSIQQMHSRSRRSANLECQGSSSCSSLDMRMSRLKSMSLEALEPKLELLCSSRMRSSR